MLCLIEELQQLHGHLQADQQLTQTSWTEIRAGYQKFIDDHSDLREVREACRQIAGEFSGIKEEAQRERKEMHKLCASVESQLSQLTAMTKSLGEIQTPQTSDGQLAEILEFTRQQQAEWLQQRAALEAELDAMRRRAVEQAEALNEQKLLAGRQQAELSGELKRMRSLLETMGSEVRAQPVVSGESAKPPADESSVLGSVLAQFEMLQRDINSRRMKRNSEADPGGKADGDGVH